MSSSCPILDSTKKIEEERMPAYQIISKLGLGANSTVWFCRDLQHHRYIALKIYISSLRDNQEVRVLGHLSRVKSQHPGSSLVRQMIEYIQAKNIIIAAKDESVFREWDDGETTEPSPRKVDNEYIVYRSRPFRRKKGWSGLGMPLLTDFGEARLGEVHEGLIQPDIYRAPEVILGMSWTAKVDRWNVGIWDLFEDHHLFDGRGPDGCHSDAQLLAEMVAMLGPPPVEWLRKSRRSLEYWDSSGQWNASEEIPSISLDDSEEYIEGEDKQMFMNFMRKMLRWDPEERQSARELLTDPWLTSP
ncbi:hypothetical protein AKAW_09609 [Aspergillus niger]|uniref:Protein kinase domain-containing protein n=1 Tax=Aspergillus niger TaxID=5061 RepID=A0A100IFI7_ASPNG|nr:hypothetical protein AKAW_09609 [Aspergillus niger]